MIDTGYRTKSGISRNKFLAFEEFKESHVWPDFVLDGDRMALDFSNRSCKDLKQLIDARARQIRAENDYVRLFFSGGADSVTMLESFHRQKLHIDEIVIYFISASDSFDDEINFELVHEVLPFFRKLSRELSNTKFTELRIGHDAFRKFYDSPDWIYERKTLADPLFRQNYNRELFECADPKFFDVYEKKQKVVEVFGEQKPRLFDGVYQLIDKDLQYLIGWEKAIGFFMSKDLIESQTSVIKGKYGKMNTSDQEKNVALDRMRPISSIIEVSKSFHFTQDGFFTDKQTISLLQADRKIVYNYVRGYMNWYLKQKEILWEGDWTTFPVGVYGKKING